MIFYIANIHFFYFVSLQRFIKIMAESVKNNMKCGEVRKSTRPSKKIMRKYCVNGKETLVHAGAKGYSDFTKHKDSKRKKIFTQDISVLQLNLERQNI